MTLERDQQTRLLAIKSLIVDEFDKGKWLDLGLLTGCIDDVKNHPRLLRSWDFGDDDYPGHVIDALVNMVTRDSKNLKIIENYVFSNAKNLKPQGPGGKLQSIIKPTVFDIPNAEIDSRLVSVMMPFEAKFDCVYAAIKSACAEISLDCLRADDIWVHSNVMQDVFSLIWRSSIVICDLTGRNPNVMYECGIAHTLGKSVVPIAQTTHDIPFDLQHHRHLSYLNNSEGLELLSVGLRARLATLST
jgi:hypothetical protein